MQGFLDHSLCEESNQLQKGNTLHLWQHLMHNVIALPFTANVLCIIIIITLAGVAQPRTFNRVGQEPFFFWVSNEGKGQALDTQAPPLSPLSCNPTPCFSFRFHTWFQCVEWYVEPKDCNRYVLLNLIESWLVQWLLITNAVKYTFNSRRCCWAFHLCVLFLRVDDLWEFCTVQTSLLLGRLALPAGLLTCT